MLSSIFGSLPFVALAAAAKNPDNIPNMVVVLTGVSLVFLILVILIVVINIQGRIFGAIEKKKQEKEQQVNVAPVAAPAPAAVAAPKAPVVEQGIPPEVVAAIMAAVSAATDGAYTLRAVSTAKQGRGKWGLAGVLQSTEPF